MPVLASIPSPDNGVIDLGPIPLHAYGLLLAIGVLVAAWIAERRWVARGFDGKTFNDMAVWIVVGGVVGARVYHVISDYQLFTHDWLARVPDLEGRPQHLGGAGRRRDRRS